MIIPCDARTAPFDLSVVTVAPRMGHATKKLIADAQGRPVSDPQRSLWIAGGHVERVTVAGLTGLRDLLAGIKRTQALVHGVPRRAAPGEVLTLLISEDYTGAPGTVARTLECFAYPDNLFTFMLDYDPDPGAPNQVQSAAALMEQLAQVLPAFAEVGYLHTTSTRSAIRPKDQPAVWLTPPHGMHLYLLACGNMVRFRELLKIKLWCAGLGFCKLATANKHTGVAAVLERALVDLTVLSPERLDYVSGAEIARGAPFYQDRPAPVLHPGGVLALDAMPEVSEAERQEYARRLEAAKETLRPTQRDTIRVRLLEQTPDLPTAEQEQEIDRRITRAERSELAPDHLVYFPSRTITAEKLSTKAGKALDSKRLCDPQEPTYGPSQAVFHWRKGDWRIVSWAHGIRRIYQSEGPTQPPWDEEDWQHLLEDGPAAALAGSQPGAPGDFYDPWLGWRSQWCGVPLDVRRIP